MGGSAGGRREEQFHNGTFIPAEAAKGVTAGCVIVVGGAGAERSRGKNVRRWEALKETAYPSTFIIEQTGRVKFAHVSNSKGDCVSAAKALEVLTAAK